MITKIKQKTYCNNAEDLKKPFVSFTAVKLKKKFLSFMFSKKYRYYSKNQRFVDFSTACINQIRLPKKQPFWSHKRYILQYTVFNLVYGNKVLIDEKTYKQFRKILFKLDPEIFDEKNEYLLIEKWEK